MLRDRKFVLEMLVSTDIVKDQIVSRGEGHPWKDLEW